MKAKRGKKGPKEKSATEQAMSRALMNQTKGSRAVEKMMEVGRGAKPAPKAPTTEKAFPFLSDTPGKGPQTAAKTIEAGRGAKPAPKAATTEKAFPFLSKKSGKSPQAAAKTMETARSDKAAPAKSSVVAPSIPVLSGKTPDNEIVIRKPRHGGVFLEQNPWTNPGSAEAPAVDEPSSEERRPTAPHPVVEVAFQPLREMRPKEPAGENAPRTLEDIVAAARRDTSAGPVAQEPLRHLAHEHRIVNREQGARPMRKNAVSPNRGATAGKKVEVTSLGSSLWNTVESTTKAIIGSGENMIHSLRSSAEKICCPKGDDESGKHTQNGHASAKPKGAVGSAYKTASAAAGKTAEGLGAIMSGAKRVVGYVVKGTLEGPVDLINGALKGAATVTNKAKRSFSGSSTKAHSARR
jgi:hypothetical protein